MKTLPEILGALANWGQTFSEEDVEVPITQYGTMPLTKAQEAIAKELMGCLPEPKITEHAKHGWIQNGTCMACRKPLTVNDIRDEFGFNTALDEVRARLTAFIGEIEK